MARKLENKKKLKFLSELGKLLTLVDTSLDIAERCKFNFSFLVSDQVGAYTVGDLKQLHLDMLCNKLFEFSKKPLSYWQKQRVGAKAQNVLEYYQDYPKHSEFKCPKNIPSDVTWCRFRLDSKKRLAGFVIPDEHHGRSYKNSEYCFDKNTFYIVFIDFDHKFYPTQRS